MSSATTRPSPTSLGFSLVVNVEEGAEMSILDGDRRPEPVDEMGLALKDGMRNYGNESNYRYGIKEGGIDYAPTTSKNVPAEIMTKIDELKQMIIDGEIAPPATLEELDSFTPPEM